MALIGPVSEVVGHIRRKKSCGSARQSRGQGELRDYMSLLYSAVPNFAYIVRK